MNLNFIIKSKELIYNYTIKSVWLVLLLHAWLIDTKTEAGINPNIFAVFKYFFKYPMT